MPSTLRFVRQMIRPSAGAVVREEATFRRGGETLPASLYHPARASGAAPSGSPLPGWIALHGLTHRGREHRELGQLVRALAASGTVVVVPDVPEWRALRVAPGATVATIRAALPELASRTDVDPDRIGVMGFSFGGTHAIMASTEPSLRERLAAVVSWGGYADLGRTLRFACLGRHNLDGETHQLEPDPYGRWIFAGNYLTGVPGHEGHAALAHALLGLAREMGHRGLRAWEPATDPIKAQARAGLENGQREVFDLLAPSTGHPVTAEEEARLQTLADALARAALEREPRLDPSPLLPEVTVPVFLAHGRDDRLIPWSELFRLQRVLPDAVIRHHVVTELFGHSFRERWLPTPSAVLEALRFVRAINRMVHLL